MHARAPRFPSAYWQEEEDGSALGGLGRYSGGLAPLVAAQVRPGKFSLLSDFYFSFLIFLLFVLT